MDPITIILTALTAGATALASEALKDAYTGLKTLLQRKFAGKLAAEVALAKHEEKPDAWKIALKEELQETGADQDQEIITAAQMLIQLAKEQQGAKTHTFEGSTSGDYSPITQTTGDHSPVAQTFGNMPQEAAGLH
jgi:hypothetical protein